MGHFCCPVHLTSTPPTYLPHTHLHHALPAGIPHAPTTHHHITFMPGISRFILSTWHLYHSEEQGQAPSGTWRLVAFYTLPYAWFQENYLQKDIDLVAWLPCPKHTMGLG